MTLSVLGASGQCPICILGSQDKKAHRRTRFKKELWLPMHSMETSGPEPVTEEPELVSQQPLEKMQTMGTDTNDDTELQGRCELTRTISCFLGVTAGESLHVECRQVSSGGQLTDSS